jgi:hypothetical protein
VEESYYNVQCLSKYLKITLDTLDIMAYTLDILLTNIEYQSNGGHHGESGEKRVNRSDKESTSSLFGTASIILPEMRRFRGEGGIDGSAKQQG